ncbi:hypothetical protein [Arthrobacter sp. 2MCAF14]|uniref:hypothetical protein n=1 Tax=Arthrobacter sp. 2MCAF14 TaxID=3232982 RepID=UPI003F91790D
MLKTRGDRASAMLSNGRRPLEAATPKLVVVITVLYVHLWIIEGAIRKWVPGTEQALYVARDGLTIVGLVLAILLPGVHKKRSGISIWIFALSLSLLCGLQVVIGIAPINVSLVGLRSYLAPFLLVYAIWCYGTKDLLSKISRIIIFYGPVELAVSAVQVLSTKTAWINKEVGTEAAYFVNGTVVRASGTFSAPAGLTLFIPLCLAISLWLLHGADRKSKIPSIVALSSAMIVTVISGARGTVLAVVIILLAYIAFQAWTMNLSGLKSIFLISTFGILIFWSALAAFPEVFSSFVARFDSAAQSEDSSGRVLTQILSFATAPVSIAGDGAGTHSMAGIALGAVGPWIETESLRWVAELGFFGWMLGFLRIISCVVFLFQIFLAPREHALRAALLCACVIPVVLYGQITQFPSAQAFFSVGLSMFILSRLPDASSQDTLVSPRMQKTEIS